MYMCMRGIQPQHSIKGLSSPIDLYTCGKVSTKRAQPLPTGVQSQQQQQRECVALYWAFLLCICTAECVLAGENSFLAAPARN